jgi:hypothetical protein
MRLHDLTCIRELDIHFKSHEKFASNNPQVCDCLLSVSYPIPVTWDRDFIKKPFGRQPTVQIRS